MGHPEVLFVQNRVCGRTWRLAKVLHDSGHPVRLLETGSPAPNHDYSVFTERHGPDRGRDVRSMVLNRSRIIGDLRGVVREHGIDVVHAMNAPDNLGAWAIRSLDVPVVHDVHDLQSTIPVGFGNIVTRPVIRMLYDRWEAYACRNADAVVVTTETVASYLQERYGPKRVEVVPNKAIAAPQRTLPRKSETEGGIHVVYAGSFTLAPDTHRSFLPGMERLARGPVHIHIYPILFSDAERKRLKEACAANPNLHYHDPVPASELVDVLTQYDWGWIHFPAMTENVRMTSATKLFEYILAGLPVIANPEGRIGAFVQENDCGIVVDRTDDAYEMIQVDRTYRMPIEKCLLDASHVLDLYREVTAGSVRKQD